MTLTIRFFALRPITLRGKFINFLCHLSENFLIEFNLLLQSDLELFVLSLQLVKGIRRYLFLDFIDNFLGRKLLNFLILIIDSLFNGFVSVLNLAFNESLKATIRQNFFCQQSLIF